MSKASEKVRLGIVGTGGIAKAHLRGYRQLLDAGYDCFEIAALCDVSEERRSEFAAEVEQLFGVSLPQFATAEEMAEKADIVAADICTPHAFHHTVAEPCLEAGLDVMVEKPCGITVKAGDRILAAAAKHDRIVAVAEQVRRGIKARAMDWAVNTARMIGEVRFFSVQGFSYRDFSEAGTREAYMWQWRLLKLLTGGGMIFDAGAHFTDMMLHLFGEIEEVSGWISTFQAPILPSPELGPKPMDVEDTWLATLRFKSGLIGNWSWSFSAPGESAATQIFYGSAGSAKDRGGWMHTFQNGGDIVLADGTEKPYEEIEEEYRAQLDEETAAKLFPHGVKNDVAIECWDFVEAVRLRRPPEIDGEAAKRAKCVCLAIYEAATAGEAVRVADVFDGKVSAYQDPINEHWGI